MTGKIHQLKIAIIRNFTATSNHYVETVQTASSFATLFQLHSKFHFIYCMFAFRFSAQNIQQLTFNEVQRNLP